MIKIEIEEGDVAPSLRVCTVDGQYIRLRRLPAPDVMELLESLTEGVEGELLSFDLDNGRSQVHVPIEKVARIEVDWELGRWPRFTSWALAKLDRWL